MKEKPFIQDVDEEVVDEAAPRDYFRAASNSNLGKRAKLRGTIDFQNANYEEITPQEAKKVFRDSPRSIVIIITDEDGNDRLVKFDDRGKPIKDAEYDNPGNYRFYLSPADAYMNRNGTSVRDIYYIPPYFLFEKAKKIYKTDEYYVRKDPEVRDRRAGNFDSPRNADKNSTKSAIRSRYDNTNSNEQRTYDGFVYSINNYLPNRPEFRILVTPGNFVLQDDGKIWCGDYRDYNNYYDTNGWRKKFIREFTNYGWNDSDTQRYWVAYQTGKNNGDVSAVRPPTREELEEIAKELKPIDKTKDKEAAMRYGEVEHALTTAKQNTRNLLRKIKEQESAIENQEQKLKNVEDRRDYFTTPTAVLNRRKSIKMNIQDAKKQVYERIRNLERLEAELDAADENDARELQKINDEIEEIARQLQNLKSNVESRDNIKVLTGPLGRKVPESLEEDYNNTKLHRLLLKEYIK